MLFLRPRDSCRTCSAISFQHIAKTWTTKGIENWDKEAVEARVARTWALYRSSEFYERFPYERFWNILYISITCENYWNMQLVYICDNLQYLYSIYGRRLDIEQACVKNYYIILFCHLDREMLLLISLILKRTRRTPLSARSFMHRRNRSRWTAFTISCTAAVSALQKLRRQSCHKDGKRAVPTRKRKVNHTSFLFSSDFSNTFNGESRQLYLFLLRRWLQGNKKNAAKVRTCMFLRISN